MEHARNNYSGVNTPAIGNVKTIEKQAGMGAANCSVQHGIQVCDSVAKRCQDRAVQNADCNRREKYSTPDRIRVPDRHWTRPAEFALAHFLTMYVPHSGPVRGSEGACLFQRIALMQTATVAAASAAQLNQNNLRRFDRSSSVARCSVGGSGMRRCLRARLSRSR
jgi:hypothetical protein